MNEQANKTPPERESPLEASFTSLLLMLSSTALVHLGEAPDPLSGEKRQDLRQAKGAIDLLDLLKEKTRGNLTKEEEDLLDELLYDLRMRYLRATGQVKL
ncbi:MAG: DUF1844 domain-containing protein [Candidatus Methylomirabilales bacterium]